MCEALAHELAAHHLTHEATAPQIADLPLRAMLPDPFDLSARPTLPSVNTLTVRRGAGGNHSMYLHKRDAGAVAIATSVYHVSPAGVFQPATLAPESQSQDFSLWRNIQREYSEEFLGNPEHDGNALEVVDYEQTEPFVGLDQARAAGKMEVYVLGIVLEPLSLWAEMLTVAIIDDETFDRLFGGMVRRNDEGTALTSKRGTPAEGVPFTAEALRRVSNMPLMA